MPSTVLQVRVDDKLKNEANEIFRHFGLDMSSALRLFLKRTVADNGLPFPMTIKEKNAKKANFPDYTEKTKPLFNPVEFIDNYKEKKI